MGTTPTSPRAAGPLAAGGGGLLWGSAAVHVDLYLTGYWRIPTVGILFVLQAAVAVALGIAATTVSRSRRPRGLAATVTYLTAAAFAFGTLLAYAASRVVGLFGFHEGPSTAGLVAGLLEVAALAAFGALVALSRPSRSRGHSPASEAGSARPATGIGGALTSSAALVTATGVVAVGLLATVVALGIGRPASPADVRGVKVAAPSPSLPVVRVRISDYEFHPDRVHARPGEEIAVTNEDPVTHTMTAVPGSVPFGKFDTGYVDPGRTVRIRAPGADGTYAFYCSIHNFMKGVLVVSGGHPVGTADG